MNLFDLFVKIGVDDQASEHISKLSSGFKTGLATAAKVGTTAVAAAATGITALTSAAVSNYAEYEQLVGGVDTLFKDSSAKLQSYAADAYKTAGMSANDYMSTATSFAASLLQSLEGDTEAAADYANMAVVDMSDNANKMGTSIEAIQNAYQGFAKQNYTMLDNLKLGYGGTKGEMERLLADADALSESFNLQVDESGALVYSYSDIVDAIHIMQMEMGIANATAEEADKTVSGSAGSMKAAWQNLVTGIADDNADLGQLIDNFVGTVETSFEGNLMPRIEKGVDGVAKLITGIAPIIVEEAPTIIDTIVPTALEAVGVLVSSIYNTLAENGGKMVESGVDLLAQLLSGLTTAITEGDAIGKLVSLIDSVASTLTDPEQLDKIMKTAQTLVVQLSISLADNAPELIESAFVIIDNLVEYFLDPENIMRTQETGLKIIVALGTGIINAIPVFLKNIEELISSTVNKLYETDWIQLGKDIIGKIWDGLKSFGSSIAGWFSGLFGGGDAEVSVDGSHASGLDYVPRNNYIANLHQGEAVLTAQEAAEWRTGRSGMQGANITINIQSGVVDDPSTARTLAQRISEELQNLSADNTALVGGWA